MDLWGTGGGRKTHTQNGHDSSLYRGDGTFTGLCGEPGPVQWRPYVRFVPDADVPTNAPRHETTRSVLAKLFW